MRIFLAGHNGMVGSAIWRALEARKRAGEDISCITADRQVLDLRDQRAVLDFLMQERPDRVVIAAAKVGGILANDRFPAEFIHDNLMIASNLILGAHQAGVTRLLNISSSCVYPKMAAQPMAENMLFSGPFEGTHEPYAIAKLAAQKLCESYNRQYGRDYRTVLPTNLYGPGDNFHPEYSHVVPAMIRRFHHAAKDRQSEVTIWGSGSPRREFLHVDDLAAASLFVLGLPADAWAAEITPMSSHLNIGCGKDVTIFELAQQIAQVTGYGGAILTDPSKPDGPPRKLLDVSKMTRLGWRPRIELGSGLQQTYDWFLAQDKQAVRGG